MNKKYIDRIDSRIMPSKKAILDYWKNILVNPTLYSFPGINNCVVGKFNDISEINTETCFHCKVIGDVERAHIIAKQFGGNDKVENLHLLCRKCHKISESSQYYWNWFWYSNNEFQVEFGKQVALSRFGLNTTNFIHAIEIIEGKKNFDINICNMVINEIKTFFSINKQYLDKEIGVDPMINMFAILGIFLITLQEKIMKIINSNGGSCNEGSDFCGH